MNQQAPFAVVLPAAGSGKRFGVGDKLLTDLAGRSVLQRSVGLFARRPDVCAIVIVTGRDRFAAYTDLLTPEFAGRTVPWALVEGGSERWESVLFGLRHLATLSQGGPSPAPRFVAVHDAARPLTPAAVIDEAFATTVIRGAALPCIAEPATLKRKSAEGTVSQTVDRRGLFQAQTPQCFSLARLLEGYEQLLARGQIHDVTDDAQVYERMGWPIPITAGSQLNMKITTADDVDLAQGIAAIAK